MNYANFDTSKHDHCGACRSAGKVTLNYGMAGDHDGVERTCSKCHGKGYTDKAAPKPYVQPMSSDADIIATLRARSGAAYAAGDDDRAARLREAAEALEVAAGIPEAAEPKFHTGGVLPRDPSDLR